MIPITMTTPAGPMFFCAPAYIIVNLLTSIHHWTLYQWDIDEHELSSGEVIS